MLAKISASNLCLLQQPVLSLKQYIMLNLDIYIIDIIPLIKYLLSNEIIFIDYENPK
jgi:hypothetical protein